METFVTTTSAREICIGAINKILDSVTLLANRGLLDTGSAFMPDTKEWFDLKLQASMDVIKSETIEEAIEITREWQVYFNNLLDRLLGKETA